MDTKQYIIEFITYNEPSKLPLIDLKVKKEREKLISDFNKVLYGNEEIVTYGSEGWFYSNSICRVNDQLYILTIELGYLVRYAHYVDDYEKL